MRAELIPMHPAAYLRLFSFTWWGCATTYIKYTSSQKFQKKVGSTLNTVRLSLNLKFHLFIPSGWKDVRICDRLYKVIFNVK